MTEDSTSDEPTSNAPDLPEGPELLDTDDPAEESRPPLASWPPPGLGRMQGDLWGVVNRLGVGGAIFTLPLLAALTLSIDPWRTGIFGDAWWIVLVTSVGGIWILMAGYVQLFRALWRWRTAVRRGYAARTVALVLADRPGDTGFIVQAARAYSLIDEVRRERLLTGRLLQVGLLVTGGLWLSAGLVLGVVLSAQGMLSEPGLAIWTLSPPALAVGVVILLRAWENGVLRKARKEWFARSWTADLAGTEIREWHEDVAARPGSVPVPVGRPDDGGGRFGGAAVATAVAGVAVLLLTVPLVTLSGVGPVIAQVAMPGYKSAALSAAETEPLRSLRLATDPEITALEAGQAYYSMMDGPTDEDEALMKDPPRSYEPVFQESERSENPTGVFAPRWGRDLMPEVADGLDPDAVAYLEELGSHPALDELGVLARAEALNEVGAIYDLPFPEDVTGLDIPILRPSGFREAVHAQVGAAVADAARGRVDAAEMKLREVVSAGLLLSEESQWLISSYGGTRAVEEGADALANLYDVTGRAEEAEALRESRGVAERAAERGASFMGARELTDMPEVVTDTNALRATRWEYLSVLTGLAPCLSLNRLVFGPPEEYESWIQEVQETLVRYESEEEVFEVLLRGFAGAESGGAVSELLGQVMGSGVGSCAALAGAAM